MRFAGEATCTSCQKLELPTPDDEMEMNRMGSTQVLPGTTWSSRMRLAPSSPKAEKNIRTFSGLPVFFESRSER